MKLKNFDISNSIELQSGNLFWDIHNFANFEGLEFLSASNAVHMKWSVSKATANPCGCYENKFSGMTLHFDNLQYLRLTPRDADMPLTEDTCVSAILKVDPHIQHSEPHIRTRLNWGHDDSFHLVLQFQSGRVIEIGSEYVELIPVT
jgi:hypothetical protein